MAERDKFVAVSLLTAAEYARWGAKLRNVYPLSGNSEFDDLLMAIDRAEEERQTRARAIQSEYKS